MDEYKDDEELQLEKLVFGDQAGFEANLRKIENLYEYSDSDGDNMEMLENETEDLFFIDEAGDDAMDIHEDSAGENTAGLRESRLLDAWHDLDDEKNAVTMTQNKTKKLRESHSEHTLDGAAYAGRLRAQYEKIYPRPEWVDRWENPEQRDDDSVSEDEEDTQVGANAARLSEILAKTSVFVQAKTAALPAHKIAISRLKDANAARRSKSGVASLHFHPASPLLVTGGLDRTLRIYHIDGTNNNFVLSIHVKDLPIATCQFSTRPDSSMVYAGGRRRFMLRWDMRLGDVEKITRVYGQEQQQRTYERFTGSPRGLYIAVRADGGWVNVLNGATGQLVRALKVDEGVADMVFLHDDAVLIVASTVGHVSEFDVESGRVAAKWVDASAVAVTKIALAPNDKHLAIGTQSGVVNVFERGATPVLVRAIGNLVTPISTLRFSHDGQILAMASQGKKDAFRLVHMPLCHVFSNWPTSTTPLGRVTDVSFTSNGQMLAVANDVGRVTLWRLNHY